MIAGRAISVVLSVLNKHISSESVCKSACDALKNITVNAGVFDEHHDLFLHSQQQTTR